MKLLVFAHTPPPHHGQSYMVQLMLEGFGGDCASGGAPNKYGIECYHVNAKMSDDMEDIGGIRPGKVLRLLKHCLTAIRYRFKFGVTTLYYVPAPAKKSAIVRDWIVMLLVRPFFKHTILHWHAFGLGHWACGVVERPSGDSGDGVEPPTIFEDRGVEDNGVEDGISDMEDRIRRGSGEGTTERIARWLTRKLMGGANLSIVLTDYNRADATLLQPKKIAVVPNGIPDPCPDFDEAVLPFREERLASRSELGNATRGGDSPIEEVATARNPPDPEAPALHWFRVLYLAHCTREKGLFDALDAVALANARLRSQASALRFRLTVAGRFMNDEEREEFESRIVQPDLQLDRDPAGPDIDPMVSSSIVTYAGFVGGELKTAHFREADCFCFPTYYHGETFGLVITEALAFGLPAVTTRWRGLPEILSSNDPLPVPIRSPKELAARLLESAHDHSNQPLKRRDFFRSRFSLEAHLTRLSEEVKRCS